MSSQIRLLSNEVINQIAAGEIVEGPSNALKELIENSIDAGATKINAYLKNGGKTRLIVEDDGDGMSEDDLKMCIQRHATSKLNSNNLFEISSFGFRGEAIPTIGSVSEMMIESNGHSISINFSEVSNVEPSAFEKGTKVTVSNLFQRIPARLKFLKSDASELSKCSNIIKNFALTKPEVSFVLRSDDKIAESFKGDLNSRVQEIFSKELFEKAIYFEEQNDILLIKGFLFHPNHSKSTSLCQRFFVNGRAVKDRTLSIATKIGYMTLAPSSRYVPVLLFVEINPFYIDVNISPTKSEVRFRDSTFVQKFVSSAISKNTPKFDRIILDLQPASANSINVGPVRPRPEIYSYQPSAYSNKYYEPAPRAIGNTAIKIDESFEIEPPKEQEEFVAPNIIEEQNEDDSHFFGEAVAQIFDAFIISKKNDQIYLIDQHAVHEKITQEKLKEKLSAKNIQILIKPVIMELSESQHERFLGNKSALESCGFRFDIVDKTAVIDGIPDIMSYSDAVDFITDLISGFDDDVDNVDVLKHIKDKIATKACHGSIRAGRPLSIDEMNSILKEMAKTKSIHQCNHNRPSIVSIKKNDISKLFEKK